MKFQAGDSFEVKESGLKGSIVGTSFNSIMQCTDYVVRWEAFPTREETYPVDECDPIWELTSRNVFIKLPQAIEFIPIDFTVGEIKVTCNGHHTPIEVGFHFTKMVCKYCDIELGRP